MRKKARSCWAALIESRLNNRIAICLNLLDYIVDLLAALYSVNNDTFGYIHLTIR